MPTGSIGIVGCGTAGQASAVLLARDGWHVTILERAPSLESIGAGLLIQPTGAAVLQELGVLDEVRSLSSPVDRLLGTSKAGKVVMDLHYADLSPGNCGLGVHRGALFNTLQHAVDAAGVETRTDVEVRSVERTAGPCRLTDGKGTSHGPFDLVLACDGAASTLRERSHLVRRDHPYRWAAFWFIGRATGESDRTLRQVFGDTRQLLGLLPTGRLAPHSPDLVSLFWSIRADTIESVVNAGVEPFKDSVRELTHLANGLLDQIDSMDQLIVARYRDVVMRSCIDPPIVYLGDAAHAMSPQLGQGANLALMDASSLASCLRVDPNIAQSLARFVKTRKRNVLFYQRASRWLMPAFQSDHRWLATPRDLIMPHLCRWRWSRRQAVQTLDGLKTGIRTANELPSTTAQ